MKWIRIAAVSAATAFLARRALARTRRYAMRDHVVAIVGGGRGLGLELAREAARRGAKLGLISRSRLELDAAQSELAAAGTRVATAVADVRDQAALATAFATVVRALGPIDVLINDAGVIEVGPVDALTVADYVDAIDVNYLGAVRAVEIVLPAMRARRAGRIVNIASVGGAIVVPHLLPYCASKFALRAYSEGLRAETARDGIVVTTVLPGLMRTGSPPHATFNGQTKREYALFALADALPLLSLPVARAARAILDAAERGDPELVVGWQAKLAAGAYALAPRTITAAMSLLARILPDGGPAPERRTGFESESPLTQSPLTALSRQATEHQNEALDPTAR
jgi:short-subunit dehydrogenase